MTFQILFKDAWTYDSNDSEVRLPISSLPKDGKWCIHGRLEIVVAGRNLPYLGYCGPDDVCMSQWITELHNAAVELELADHAEYVFDEGEQGQPAFKFERCGESVFISIIRSELSETEGDSDWQRVECSLNDFLSQIASLITMFTNQVLLESPAGGKNWIKNTKKFWRKPS